VNALAWAAIPLAVFILVPVIRRICRNRFLWEVCERQPNGCVILISLAPMTYGDACEYLLRYHLGESEDDNFFLRRVERKP
jgi:hypothetical protein